MTSTQRMEEGSLEEGFRSPEAREAYLARLEQAEKKRIRTGKALAITASILSFLSAVGLLALLFSSFLEEHPTGRVVAFCLMIGSIFFPAFMLAGFNWARDGFIFVTGAKAMSVLAVLLTGEYFEHLYVEIVVTFLLWTAFYVGEAVLFGFSPQIREYQYDKRTRVESWEKEYLEQEDDRRRRNLRRAEKVKRFLEEDRLQKQEESKEESERDIH